MNREAFSIQYFWILPYTLPDGQIHLVLYILFG